MKTFVQLMALTVFLAFAGLGAAPQQIRAEGGGKVPDFKSDDYKGNIVKFSDFKGKVLVIHHVAPGCRDCNNQLNSTMALRKKYGKENVKSILFIYEGSFGKNREKGKGLVKDIVENKKSPFDTRTVPDMDFDAYLVWDNPIYVAQKGNLGFKKEPILTCIIDPEGNFLLRQMDRPIPQEEMDKAIGKFLKPLAGEEPAKENPPKEEPKGDEMTPEEAQDIFNQGIEQLNAKKFDEAVAAFKKIADKLPKEGVGITSAYNVACAYALKGEKATALVWLETAIDNGFTKFDHIEKDTDLDSLRDEPKYKELMNRKPM